MPPPSASRRGSLDGQREASRRHSLPLSSPRPGLVRQNATKVLLHKSMRSSYRMGNDLGEDMRLYWQYGKKFIHDSLGIVFMGVGLGLLSLYLFCAEDPKALPKGHARLARGRRAAPRAIGTDGGTPKQKLLLDECTVVCDLYFAAVVLSLEKGPTYTYPRGDFAASRVVCETAAGTIFRDLGDKRPADVIGRTAHEQVLATHQWLAHLVRKGGDLDLVPTAAAESAYDDHRPLLLEYFSSLKIKTTPLPLPLQCLVSILKIAYTVFIFPQTMAYAFVMKLSSGHHEKFFIWRNPVYICAYLLITTLGVLFFTVMHLIALELDDPYGDDLSDLPMKQIHNALKADLEAIHHTALFRTLMSQHLDDDDDAVL
ncbi:hypothetical protein JL720_9251 [Aureococcus anophagefferens]|nr:hypothetical protein JL720_9251 [Aureococcus anophagefferens]